MALWTATEPTFSHPEARDGEVLFSNMTAAEFEGLEWTSKRMGRTAYDGEGRKLAFEDWFPVFVDGAELHARGRGLRAERTLFREQRAKKAA